MAHPRRAGRPQPNIDRMLQLGLSGMAEALEEQGDIADIDQLGFDDRLTMMLEREAEHRDRKSYLGHLRQAQLRIRADIQDVDCRAGRGIVRTTLTQLAAGDWIRQALNRHAHLLFNIVSSRSRQRSTIITTNRPFAEWGEAFPNAACLVALVDRLVYNAEILAIDGDSYRRKEAEQRQKARSAERRRRRSTKDRESAGKSGQADPGTPPV